MIWQIIVANAWRVQIMQDDDDLVIGCNFYLSAISSSNRSWAIEHLTQMVSNIILIDTNIFLYS